MASKSVESFAAERIEQKSTGWHPWEDIWEAYLDHCEGYYPAVADTRTLGRELREAIGFQVESSRRMHRGEQLHGLVGLRLVAPPSVQTFGDERIEQESTAWTPWDEIWAAYEEHCRANEYPPVDDRSVLGKDLRVALDFDVESSKRTVDGDRAGGLVGMKLVEPGDDDER